MRESVYLSVKASLEEGIRNGKFPPGSQIPSESDLAAEFGFSRQTIRRALGDLVRDDLIFKRPGKGAFVRDPGQSANGHRGDRVQTIGTNARLPVEGQNWYSSKIIAGIQSVLSDRHARLALLETDAVGGLLRGIVDGVVLVSAREQDYPLYERLAKMDIHPALINRITQRETLAYFSADFRKESERAVRLLLDEGHRKIGVVTAGQKWTADRARISGIEDAARAQGGGVETRVCTVPANQPGRVYADLLSDFLAKNRLSAIYLLNGSLMVPLYAALQRLDLRAPEDLEVVCFDDIGYLASHYDHRIRYIKMPLSEMAADATEYLLKKVEGGRAHPVQKKLYQAAILSGGAEEHHEAAEYEEALVA